MEIGPISGGFRLPIRPSSQRDIEPDPILDIDESAKIGSETYTASREESSSGMETDPDDLKEDDEEELTEQEPGKPAPRHLNFFA